MWETNRVGDRTEGGTENERTPEANPVVRGHIWSGLSHHYFSES